MASIGSIQFIRLDWARQPQGEAVRMLERPGADGVGYQAIGKRARPTRARSICDVANAAAVDTLLQDANAIRGSLQTVVEDDGTSVDNVFVHQVVKVMSKRVLTPVGGLTAGEWLVTLEWVLQETQVT